MTSKDKGPEPDYYPSSYRDLRARADATAKRLRLSDDEQLKLWMYIRRQVAQEVQLRASQRARRFSWAHVGQLLGMSRQNAYKTLRVPLTVDGRTAIRLDDAAGHRL